MNIMRKRAEEKLETKKYKKNEVERIEKTLSFEEKNKINIIYQNIDFLKCKLEKTAVLEYIENNLLTPITYSDIIEAKIENIYKKEILFNKFFIVYAGLVFGNQKKLYDIYDFDKNKIGQIVIKATTLKKINQNVIDSLEFSGLFFKCYSQYLDDFFDYFLVSKKEKNIIKRLDYCIDIAGIELFEYIPYIKEIFKTTKDINGLTATDIKKLQENNTDIKYGRKEIYINYFSEKNDFKIYDKILNILQKYSKRKVNGKNPYQDYLDSDVPIIRFELKKKSQSFKGLKDNSINWIFDNIENLFFDYLLKYFEIDLSLYVDTYQKLNGKDIFLAKEEKEKNLKHSLTMALAYMKNIQELTGNNGLQAFIYKNFPKVKDSNYLDYVSPENLSDYFLGISDDINISLLDNYETPSP